MKDEDSKQVQNYILQRTLGQGTFGKVQLGYHTIADEYVAIKILEKRMIEKQSDLVRVQREISILKKVSHPNVIKLYEVILQQHHVSKIIWFLIVSQTKSMGIIESESCVYLVMEYVKGGELYEYIIKKKYLPENIAVRYFQQLIFATEYLHSQYITHRDLKPENLLLDENRQLKIADFGLSFISQTQGEYLKTACGSPCYAAPEMLGIHQKQQVGKTYEGTKSDIWSCGIILFAMLCGYLQTIFKLLFNLYSNQTVPFEHENTQQLYELIKTSDFEKPEYLSKNAKDLLTKELILNKLNTVIQYSQNKTFIVIYPSKHWGLQHPFFLQHTSIPSKNLSLNDQGIIAKMIEMGYQQNQIITQLQQNKHNTLTTIYYLLQKKCNQPQKRGFFQNIQNIGNLKLDINQKRFTISKFQPSQQGSPILEKIDKTKQSIRPKLEFPKNSRKLIYDEISGNKSISVQSKRVSVQIENQRQKTNSVQEKHCERPCIFTQLIQDQKSRSQSRKNSKHQASIQRRDLEQAIKTDNNEENLSNQKGIYAQVRQRNKTQPNKNDEGSKYFEKASKLNTSHQMAEKNPQYSPYINMNISNHRQLFKQIYNGNLYDLMKKKGEFKTRIL